MISDRRRVERALVPGMLLMSVFQMQGARRAPTIDLNPVIDALQFSVGELGDDIDQPRRAKLRARCNRVTEAAFIAAEFWGEDTSFRADARKIYLAVSIWLMGLFERDIVVAGDCPFVQAFEALAEAMASHADELAVMERSAMKAAERLRRFFEREGYFQTNQGMREAA